jgi:hypothetical protein
VRNLPWRRLPSLNLLLVLAIVVAVALLSDGERLWVKSSR